MRYFTKAVKSSVVQIDEGSKFHFGEDVGLEVEAFGDFDEAEAAGDELEDGALGDVEDLLAIAESGGAVEADVLDFLHKLGLAFGLEGAAEDEAAGALGDVYKAADASEAVGEAGDIDAAFGIDLDGTKDGDVEAAAVVVVELRGLVDDGLWEVAAAEAEAGGGDAACGAALDGEGELLEAAGFGSDHGDGLGEADAEIDDVSFAHLLQGAGADAFAIGLGHDWESEGAVAGDDEVLNKSLAESLVVMEAAGGDDIIHQQAGNADGFGIW